MSRFTCLACATIAITLLVCDTLQTAFAQESEKKENLVTVQGTIENDAREEFRVEYDELKTALRKIVVPKEPPFPENWNTMTEPVRKKWLTDYFQSDKGKKFLQDRAKELTEAPSFEVKYNSKGNFVIYDVPPGVYGLQGRIDKEINGIRHGFEVFAEIKVLEDVDQLKLEPIPITITPFFQRGQPAPPINVESNTNGNLNFDLAKLKGRYIFLNFMSSKDLPPAFQKQVQEMQKALGESHKVTVVTIAIDEERENATEWLKANRITFENVGFTDGWEHEIIDDYGIRSTPSAWLISPDRKIAISQHEFFRLARTKPSITALVRDRIDGKDTPTPATGSDQKKDK